jgi:hypothetical protein
MGNHIKWISIVNIGICIRAGPGHKPPIPHPNPNRIDPITSFQSMIEF